VGAARSAREYDGAGLARVCCCCTSAACSAGDTPSRTGDADIALASAVRRASAAVAGVPLSAGEPSGTDTYCAPLLFAWKRTAVEVAAEKDTDPGGGPRPGLRRPIAATSAGDWCASANGLSCMPAAAAPGKSKGHGNDEGASRPCGGDPRPPPPPPPPPNDSGPLRCGVLCALTVDHGTGRWLLPGPSAGDETAGEGTAGKSVRGMPSRRLAAGGDGDPAGPVRCEICLHSSMRDWI
jgi:hypothetical protein